MTKMHDSILFCSIWHLGKLGSMASFPRGHSIDAFDSEKLQKYVRWRHFLLKTASLPLEGLVNWSKAMRLMLVMWYFPLIEWSRIVLLFSTWSLPVTNWSLMLYESMVSYRGYRGITCTKALFYELRCFFVELRWSLSSLYRFMGNVRSLWGQPSLHFLLQGLTSY